MKAVSVYLRKIRIVKFVSHVRCFYSILTCLSLPNYRILWFIILMFYFYNIFFYLKHITLFQMSCSAFPDELHRFSRWAAALFQTSCSAFPDELQRFSRWAAALSHADEQGLFQTSWVKSQRVLFIVNLSFYIFQMSWLLSRWVGPVAGKLVEWLARNILMYRSPWKQAVIGTISSQ